MIWTILSFYLLIGGIAMLYYSKHIESQSLECFSVLLIVISAFGITESVKRTEQDYLLNATLKGQVNYSTIITNDNDTIYKFEGYK